MLDLIKNNRFLKDYELIKKRGWDLSLLSTAVKLLIEQKPLPKSYKKHPLKGKYAGYIDIHIAPDWILIYKIKGNELQLYRTGTHSDLF